MKKLATVTLALIALVDFADLGIAQQKGKEKSQPTGVETKQPATGEKTVDKASPKLMTGTVTQVNEKERTFTLVSKGKEYRFTFQKLEWPLKVGAVVDVTYTGTLGGSKPVESINLNSSRSNID
jgi:hypothetical protein